MMRKETPSVAGEVPVKCGQCRGTGTIKVLGSGGDYEDWPCNICRRPEYQRSVALLYGAADSESE